MKKILSLCLIFTFNSFANNGAGLLINDGAENIDLTSKLVKQKMYKLDNPFKVQLFATWKAQRIQDENTNKWVELVLEDELQKAFVNYPLILKRNNTKFQYVMKGTLAYLQWKLNLPHAFTEHWIDMAANADFLNNELGLALDQVIGSSATKWILNNGIVLTNTQKEKLTKIEKQENLMNYAFQAWKNQRKGETSLEWVNKLNSNDPMRIKLIYTAITDYANQGKLDLSGQLIKKAIEPYIENSEDTAEISHYYMTLGRLLYQAKAYEAADVYYSLIPEESKDYMQAQIERTWTAIQRNDMALAKGILSTLELDLFKDTFMPDIYLTRSIVNLKTCQFVEIKKDLNHFVKTNRVWANKIAISLKSDKPEMIDFNVYTKAIIDHKNTLKAEKQRLSMYLNKNLIVDNTDIASFYKNMSMTYEQSLVNSNKLQFIENRNQWLNRQKMLDDAIYRMKFVRIEFLSQMRNYALNIPMSNTDKVSTYSAAPERNEIKFPNDGVLWGDDLFSMTSRVQNLCLKRLKNE